MKRIGRLASARALFVVACVVGIAWPGIAGTGYKVECSECDFEADFLYGGGIPGEKPAGVVIGTGYCCTCKKIVHSFSNPEAADDKDAKDPGPIGDVFCHDNGKTYTLYPCPDCGKPFIAIREEEFHEDGEPVKLFCPKCGKQGLQIVSEFRWD